MTNQTKKRKTVLSREKWLEMAIDTLAYKCKSKFNLDSLLNVMPVTKGSFYNHFKNRADFLVALVEYWDRHETKSVIDELKTLPKGMSPQDRLWELMCVIYDMKFNKYELLIRSLTREVPEIKEAVKAVDQKRMEAAGGLFSEMGFEGDELQMRTLAFVTTTSQDGNVFSDLSPEAYRRQLKLRHEFFVRR
jgi:AcrR family transcriptional regulator